MGTTLRAVRFIHCYYKISSCSVCKFNSQKLSFIRTVWGLGLIITDWQYWKHEGLFKMLLNSDWCMEVSGITFFQLRPAQLKPVTKTRRQIQKSHMSYNQTRSNFGRKCSVFVGPPSNRYLGPLRSPSFSPDLKSQYVSKSSMRLCSVLILFSQKLHSADHTPSWTVFFVISPEKTQSVTTLYPLASFSTRSISDSLSLRRLHRSGSTLISIFSPGEPDTWTHVTRVSTCVLLQVQPMKTHIKKMDDCTSTLINFYIQTNSCNPS